MKVKIQIELNEDLNLLIESYQAALKRHGVVKSKQHIVEEMLEGRKSTMKSKLIILDETYNKAMRTIEEKYQ